MKIAFGISVEDFERSTELETAKMAIQIQGPRSKNFEVWTQGKKLNDLRDIYSFI